jgi:hypothetical protein
VVALLYLIWIFDSPLVRLAAVQSPRLHLCIYLGVSALHSSRDYYLYVQTRQFVADPQHPLAERVCQSPGIRSV